jgi:hypothetical protein
MSRLRRSSRPWRCGSWICGSSSTSKPLLPAASIVWSPALPTWSDSAFTTPGLSARSPRASSSSACWASSQRHPCSEALLHGPDRARIGPTPTRPHAATGLDTGIPGCVILLRTFTATNTSLFCASGVRDRSASPMMRGVGAWLPLTPAWDEADGAVPKTPEEITPWLPAQGAWSRPNSKPKLA